MKHTVELTRREMLALTVAAPVTAALQRPPGGPDLKALRASTARALTIDGASAERVSVLRDWNGSVCRSRVVNRGDAVRLREVVLFDVPLDLPPSTSLYGEGFQMLSQTAGTLGSPEDLSQYTDAEHYKMPVPGGSRVYYGLLTMTPAAADTRLFAFTSCRRFSGQLRTTPTSLQVVVDTEGLELGAGRAWDLEEFTFTSGSDRAALLEELSARLARNHPPLHSYAPPTGWCSWYSFGANVTAKQVLDNLDAIEQKIPGLMYVQVDDGYQRAMGDWLETGSAFGGDVQRVLDAIRSRGLQPAIWVAPFIAEEQSHLFQQHRNWFVKDMSGQPLRSDLVTFGGWRRGPWYVLDGTHPDVQAHFERVFGTMRQKWGCTYFKLDANFWGAIHGGRFHDPTATRVEAYRRGMEAILRGAQGSFILGCNHPIWPSLGLIHGSRSSNDIRRSWDRIKTTARQNLMRNWQNGRLWWNDPDAVVFSGDLTDDEYQFHAAAIFATGGMILSGDDLTRIPPARLALLRRLMPPTGVAASFRNDRLDVGGVDVPGARVICAFNWDDAPATITTRVASPVQVTDFWTGEPLGRQGNAITLKDMRPHSARLLVCEST